MASSWCTFSTNVYRFVLLRSANILSRGVSTGSQVCVRIAMAGWLHGVFVVDWLFVFPLCGFSLSLFCNYPQVRSRPMQGARQLASHKLCAQVNDAC